MKRIINGVKYDTETAAHMSHYSSRIGVNDLYYYEEDLYRKFNGKYFLYGEGNAGSKYSEVAGLNSWSPGSGIIELTEDEAKRWVEQYANDCYEKVFGECYE